MSNYQTFTKSTFLGNCRSASRNLAQQYPDYLIFIFEKNFYRAYDENARLFCDLINIDPYENISGEVNVKIVEEEFKKYFSLQIEDLHKNYIVKNHEKLEIHKYHPINEVMSARTRSANLIIKENQYVKITDGSETFDVVLIKNGLTVELEITTNNEENTTTIGKPITNFRECIVLSEASNLYQALLGKNNGSLFNCNGKTYKILNVFDPRNRDAKRQNNHFNEHSFRWDNYTFIGSKAYDAIKYYNLALSREHIDNKNALAVASAQKFGVRVTFDNVASYREGIVIGNDALKAAKYIDNEYCRIYQYIGEYRRSSKMARISYEIHRKAEELFQVKVYYGFPRNL